MLMCGSESGQYMTVCQLWFINQLFLQEVFSSTNCRGYNVVIFLADLTMQTTANMKVEIFNSN